MPDALSASCIYCDDVRRELIGGKITYVGVYPPGGIVLMPPKPPAVLHRLCVVGFLHTPADKPVRSVRCELRLDDAVLHNVALPAQPPALQPSTQTDQKRHTVQVVMEFNGLSLPKPGLLHLVMIADEQEIDCAGLSFVPQPTPNAAAPA